MAYGPQTTQKITKLSSGEMFTEAGNWQPDEAMQQVLGEMDMDQRREFIETLFRLLTATGAVTLTDINERRLRRALGIARRMAKEKTVSRFVVEVIEQTVKEYVAVSAQVLRDRLPHFHREKGAQSGE